MKHVKLFEQFVNEEKIKVKKEIKELKRMGYNAEKWGDGIIIRDHTAPNPNWDGTVDYSWTPSEGIYSDDDQYSGEDQSYDKFLDILDCPGCYEGQWE